MPFVQESRIVSSGKPRDARWLATLRNAAVGTAKTTSGCEMAGDAAEGGGRHGEDDQRVLLRFGRIDAGPDVGRQRDVFQIVGIVVVAIDRGGGRFIATDQHDVVELGGEQGGEGGPEGTRSENGGGSHDSGGVAFRFRDEAVFGTLP